MMHEVENRENLADAGVVFERAASLHGVVKLRANGRPVRTAPPIDERMHCLLGALDRLGEAFARRRRAAAE
jgi:hypothetical protein